MDDCVQLANETGAEVAQRLPGAGLPLRRRVERPGAEEPGRHPAGAVRRARGEDVAAEWAPDYGPSAPHPAPGRASSARACRSSPTTSTSPPTGSTSRRRLPPPSASAVAGLRHVKAMGVALEDRGIVQVSMNLTNYLETPMFRVFDAVKREAERYGVAMLESEIVRACAGRSARQHRRTLPAARTVHAGADPRGRLRSL